MGRQSGIVLLLVCLSLKSISSQLTDEFDCSDKENGNYENPVDCASFYKCSAGDAYRYECHDPLLFNPDLLVCDWPDNFECRATSEPKTTTEAVQETTVAEPEPTTVAEPEPTTVPEPEPTTVPEPEPTTVPEPEPTTVSEAEPTTVAEQETTAADDEATTDDGSGEEDFDCTDKPSGLYPNPTDCNTFYKCSNGYTYLYDCPADLVFNPDLLVCDWPENVPECSGSGSNSTTVADDQETTPAEDEATTDNGSGGEGFDCLDKPDGLYPNPADCTAFYMCSNGYTYLYDCPADLVFNPDLLICDWLENVPECGNSNATTIAEGHETTPAEDEATTDNGSGEEGFDCSDKPSGLYPNPTDCKTFYKCSNGYTYLYDCPADLVFNPDLLVCDWPENVPECSGSNATTVADGQETTPAEDEATTDSGSGSGEEDFDCSDKPNGLYPNPTDCTTFYKCSNGYTYLYDCPADLVFNPSLLICDWPENVPECSGSGSNSTTVAEGQETTPAEGQETTPAAEEGTTDNGSGEGFDCSDKSDGLYPNPSDCATFYMCSNGYTYLFDCPADLVFNPDLLICDWAENVPECGNSNATTIAEGQETTPTEVEATTDNGSGEEDFDCSDKPNGLYPNPSDCTTFYKCSNGYTYLYDCPADLVFNPDLLICDWPENVPECSGSGSNSTTVADEQETTTDNGSGQKTTPAEDETTTDNGSGQETTPAENEPTTTQGPGGEFSCEGLPCGHYADPKNCSNFYECSDDVASSKSCPAGLVFNPELQVCDFPANVPSCAAGSTTEAEAEATTEAEAEQTTEAEAESTTEAEAEATTEAAVSTTSGPEEFSCAGRPNGLYPNPADCHSFYKCSNTYAYLYNCPSILLFNPALLVCDWPQNVPSCAGQETTKAPTTTTTTEPTTQPPVTTPESIPTTAAPVVTSTEAPAPTTESAPEFSCDGRPSGLYPNPADCTTFYKCSNGYKYLYNCPGNLLFNPSLLVCDWPENANCSVA